MEQGLQIFSHWKLLLFIYLFIKNFYRYIGDIGDVVIGRIVEVQQKRWKVIENNILVII